MLVISRKFGQAFQVGKATITIQRDGASRVRLLIQAPREVQVSRLPRPKEKGWAP